LLVISRSGFSHPTFTDSDMRYRSIGSTDVTVSEIGFGAWGIGGATPGATSYGATDDRVSLRALAAAFDAGITFFDTSAVYGYGHSEELIGRVFADRRDSVTIATKAGLARYGEPADFSPSALDVSLKSSLARLGTGYVDLFQLHNPPVDVINAPDRVLEFVERARRAGTVRAFGVSVRAPEDGSLAIKRMRPDALQVNLNLLDQRAVAGGLIEHAFSAGVSIIARTPLSFGFLGGGVDESTRFAANDHRSRWPADQVARWCAGARRMMAFRDPTVDETEANFALRFCLSFTSVASVIPGILTAAEAVANARASEQGPMAPQTLAAIRAAYGTLDLFGESAPTDPGKVDAV
jgi:aryl-alcohol dehydrogenase-like predicted oxidoreductase